VDRILSIPFEPVTYDFSEFARVKEEVGDNGIIMYSINDAVGNCFGMMEFGEATVWALTEPEHFEKTVRTLHERIMENLRCVLEYNAFDLIRIVGAENMTIPYMPPALCDRFWKPCVKEMVDLIHSKGCKTRIHSHGNIRDSLPMFIETGADALDPVEAPPDGNITLGEVKEMTKGRMCLFGNIQPRVMEYGTEKEIREAVKRCMDEAKSDGGFVIMPTSAPLERKLPKKIEENYFAFIDAALEYGRY